MFEELRKVTEERRKDTEEWRKDVEYRHRERVRSCPRGPWYHFHGKDFGWVMLVTAALLALVLLFSAVFAPFSLMPSPNASLITFFVVAACGLLVAIVVGWRHMPPGDPDGGD